MSLILSFSIIQCLSMPQYLVFKLWIWTNYERICLYLFHIDELKNETATASILSCYQSFIELQHFCITLLEDKVYTVKILWFYGFPWFSLDWLGIDRSKIFLYFGVFIRWLFWGEEIGWGVVAQDDIMEIILMVSSEEMGLRYCKYGRNPNFVLHVAWHIAKLFPTFQRLWPRHFWNL